MSLAFFTPTLLPEEQEIRRKSRETFVKVWGFIMAVLFLTPLSTHAQVIITEIMYGLPGSDKDREWIEIFNGGSEAVDLTDWRFVEGGERHIFLPYPKSGDVVVRPDTYAVVVIVPDAFLSDWPGFSGKILDSSFSLKNSEGETLSILDQDGVETDTVTYDPLWGAKEDGNSLQKIGGSWSAAAPTPGAAGAHALSEGDKEGNDGNKSGAPSGTSSLVEPAENENIESDNASNNDSTGYVPNTQNIKAVIHKRSNTAIVGAASEFRGYALGLKGEPITNARLIWSFGDGAVQEGQNVRHTYHYPGDYVVSLSASSGQYSAEARMRVSAVTADIRIQNIGTQDDFFIELLNSSPYELDLGGWILISGKSHFILPKNTFILPNATLTIPHAVTKLSYNTEAHLKAPNGTDVAVYTAPHSALTSHDTGSAADQGNRAAGSAQVTFSQRSEETEAPVEVGTKDPYIAGGKTKKDDVSTQVAALTKAFPETYSEEQENIWPWLFGTVLFLGVGVSAFFAMRLTPRRKLEKEEVEAEKFTLEEEEPT